MSLLLSILTAVGGNSTPTSTTANTLVVSTTSAVATWSDNNYIVRLYSNTSASTVGGTLLATSNLSATSITFPNSLTPGNYYYTIISASNIFGTSMGLIGPLAQTLSPPPTITSFTNTNNVASLQLSAANGATSYSVELYSNATSSNTLAGTLVSTTPIASIASPSTFSLTGGRYYYTYCYSSNTAGLSSTYTTSPAVFSTLDGNFTYVKDASNINTYTTRDFNTFTSIGSEWINGQTGLVIARYASAGVLYKWFLGYTGTGPGGAGTAREVAKTSNAPTTGIISPLSFTNTNNTITDLWVDPTGTTVYATFYALASYGFFYSSIDGGETTKVSNFFTTNHGGYGYKILVNGSTIFLSGNTLVGSTFAVDIRYSTNGGSNFTSCTYSGFSPSNLRIQGIMYFNSGYYAWAVSTSGSAIYRLSSSDGITWTSIATSGWLIGSGGIPLAYVRKPTTGVIVAVNISSAAYSTDNGLTFIPLTSLSPVPYLRVFFNGEWFAMNTLGTTVHFSVDGSNWISRTDTPLTSINFIAIQSNDPFNSLGTIYL
jgi:hypothetical protein